MRVKWTMKTGYSGADHSGEVEIEDETLEGKTPEEVEQIIEEEVREDALQYIDWYWDVVEE